MLIYRITNTINGKAYIGVTGETLCKRWHGHIYHAKDKTRTGALQLAIRKYGQDMFSMELLTTVDDPREARLAERMYIAQFGTMVPNGYNMTTGGELEVGHHHSAETRAKLSANAKRTITPQFIAACRNGLGKKRSAESRAKMSAAQKGHKRNLGHSVSPETRDKIRRAVLRAIAEGRLVPRENPWKGKHLPKAHREKLAVAGLKRAQTPEWVETLKKMVERGRVANTGDGNIMRRSRAAVEASAAKRRGAKRTEEMKQKMRIGRRKQCLLSAEVVAQIKDRLSVKESHSSIGRLYGVSRSNIGKISRRETWSDIVASSPSFVTGEKDVHCQNT